jgi:hypothetical protein
MFFRDVLLKSPIREFYIFMTFLHAIPFMAATSDLASSSRKPQISSSQLRRTRMRSGDSGAVYDGSPDRVSFCSPRRRLRANRKWIV